MAKKSKTKIRETRVLYLDGCIATVHFPELTDEERERRQRELNRAAADLMMEVFRIEDRKKKQAANAASCDHSGDLYSGGSTGISNSR